MSGLIGTIASGTQALLGVGQMVGSLFMPKPKLPEYNIPEEVYQNMTDAEYWSFMGLPEAQKEQYMQQISRIGADALYQADSRKAGMGMISNIAQQQSDASTNLLAMDASQRMKNLQNFWNARSSMAEQKGIKQQVRRENVMYKRDKRAEMAGAGMQNVAGGLSTFGNLFGLSGAESLKDFFGKTTEE